MSEFTCGREKSGEREVSEGESMGTGSGKVWGGGAESGDTLSEGGAGAWVIISRTP